MATADPGPEAGTVPSRPAAAVVGVGQFCPNCEMPLEDGAVLCTACGYDVQSGTVLADAAKPALPEAPPVSTALQAFMDFFPGFYFPGVIILALLCAGLASVLAVFTMFVFALGAWLSAGAIGVATLAVWMQAVTLMCVGRAEFFNTALGDIEGTQFGVFMGLVLTPPFAVWAVLGWISSGNGN
jgi:hypothetical protein